MTHLAMNPDVWQNLTRGWLPERFLKEPNTVICLVTEDLIRRYLRECLPRPFPPFILFRIFLPFFFHGFPFCQFQIF